MNNTFMTTEEFSNEIIRELTVDKASRDALIEIFKNKKDCDWTGLVDLIRSDKAKQAALHLKERNTPNNLSKRKSLLLSFNKDGTAQPAGNAWQIFPGFSSKVVSAGFSEPLTIHHQEGSLEGVSLEENNTVLFNKEGSAGFYQFLFSGKLTTFLYNTSVINNAESCQSKSNLTFLPDNSIQDKQPVDIILLFEKQVQESPTEPKEIFCKTIASTWFNKSDWENNRVVNFSGSLIMKVKPAHALRMKVLFQRRRTQGKYQISSNSGGFFEALGLVKDPTSSINNTRPLMDGSNYLRITKIAA